MPGVIYPLCLGLYSLLPDEVNAIAASGIEVSGDGYERVPLTNLTVEESQVTSSTISFPAATGPWTDIVGFGIFDNEGIPLFYAPLGGPVAIQPGDNIVITGLTFSGLGQGIVKPEPEISRKTLWERLNED